MNQLLKYLDYFFVNRPILFFPGWATLIAGYLAATNNLNLIHAIFNNSFHPEIWNSMIFWGMFIFSLAMGGSFILNQIQDVSSDNRNKKLFLLGDGHIPKKQGYIESSLLIILSLLIAAKMGLLLFLSLLLFIFVTGYLYNFPPFNFKDRPVSGLIANMIMGWLAFTVGWVLIEPMNKSLVLHSLPYLFFNTSLYLLTTLPDMKGDASSKKITFPVKYGFNVTIWISFFFYLIALVLSLLIKDQLLLVILILNSFFVVNMNSKKNVASAILVIKMGTLFFCIVLSFKFPLFFLGLTFLFFFTRFYYKRRFQFDYPNFK